MAALNGWCNRMAGHAPPLIWTDTAKNSTNMEDCHLLIKTAVIDTAKQHGLEISKFYLTDGMLKDIIKLDFAPGGGLPVISNL